MHCHCNPLLCYRLWKLQKAHWIFSFARFALLFRHNRHNQALRCKGLKQAQDKEPFVNVNGGQRPRAGLKPARWIQVAYLLLLGLLRIHLDSRYSALQRLCRSDAFFSQGRNAGRLVFGAGRAAAFQLPLSWLCADFKRIYRSLPWICRISIICVAWFATFSLFFASNFRVHVWVDSSTLE